MTDQVNTYLALFIITITASLAAAIIVHVANNNTFTIIYATPVDYIVHVN